MKFERSSGILLHPTSLPGEFGIGEIGPQAIAWVDFLAECGCTLWQVLPLGPTGYGDSPYQCFSAFAGNPYLISLESLLDDGLLEREDLAGMPDFPAGSVDFGALIPWKIAVLEKSYSRFQRSAGAELLAEFQAFQVTHAEWLPDFALFMALKGAHGGASWATWDLPLRQRDDHALAAARQELADPIQRQIYFQFLFFHQWWAVRQHANLQGIQIIGDIPIFVAHDSADVWAHPELFYLNERSQPKLVAGVPPDYFSPTGQLWGNPLYRWKVHQQDNYRWWISRIRSVLELVDIIRLDHFRGFAGYWAVSGKAKTAEKGNWRPGPGKQFLKSVQAALGELPLIAEDLGVITPDVVALREAFGLPGMKILQFAFASGPSDSFLPHRYPRNCVVYTGTHDNDTVLGWYERVPDDERAFYRRYLDRDGNQVSWDLIRASWATVATFALAPLQDFLSLGNEARMNYPGRPSGNWSWRMSADAIDPQLTEFIKEINYLYERMPESK